MTTTLVRRRGFEVDAIDVFCGFGGSSQGIHAAGATVRAAANHSELALECHARNFPDTDHWQADLVDPDNPQVLNRAGKRVAGRYLDPADLPAARFAWFSPSCTHHSQANATKVYERGLQLAIDEDEDWDEQAYVNSERSRVTMSCVLRYAERRRPDVIAVENVIEVTKWGPGRNGATFRWWMTELRNLGYEIRPLFLNSMFFPPCPQSRDRVYIVAWRKGNAAPDLDFRPPAFCTSQRCGGLMVDAVQTWRHPTAAWLGMTEWGKYGKQYDYTCPDCRQVVHPASWMALSAIDFTDLGQRLGDRKRLPAPNTLERIRRCIRKYWYAPPVLAEASSTLSQRNDAALVLLTKNTGDASEAKYRGHHPAGPLSAVTTQPTESLVALMPNRTNNAPIPASGALAPVMTSATQGVVLAAHTKGSEGAGTRARHVADQLFTQTTTAEFAWASIPTLRGGHMQDQAIDEQLPTISAAGRHQALAAFSKINGGPGDTDWHQLTDPFNAVTSRDTHGLVLLPWIDQWRSDPALITEQLATVTTHLRHSLATIPPYEGEITDDILMSATFRMLKPDPELRRAMAFHDDYILIGTNEQKTAGLGNAVCPPVSEWVSGRCIDSFRSDREAVA